MALPPRRPDIVLYKKPSFVAARKEDCPYPAADEVSLRTWQLKPKEGGAIVAMEDPRTRAERAEAERRRVRFSVWEPEPGRTARLSGVVSPRLYQKLLAERADLFPDLPGQSAPPHWAKYRELSERLPCGQPDGGVDPDQSPYRQFLSAWLADGPSAAGPSSPMMMGDAELVAGSASPGLPLLQESCDYVDLDESFGQIDLEEPPVPAPPPCPEEHLFLMMPAPEDALRYRELSARRGSKKQRDDKLRSDRGINLPPRRQLNTSVLKDFGEEKIHQVLSTFFRESPYAGNPGAVAMHDPVRRPNWVIVDFEGKTSYGPGPLPFGTYGSQRWVAEALLAEAEVEGITIYLVLWAEWMGPLAATWMPKRCLCTAPGLLQEFYFREGGEAWSGVPIHTAFGDREPLTRERLGMLSQHRVYQVGAGQEQAAQAAANHPSQEVPAYTFEQEPDQPTPFLTPVVYSVDD